MLTRPMVSSLALLLVIASAPSCKMDRSKPRRGAADAAVAEPEPTGKAPIASGGGGADGGAARADPPAGATEANAGTAPAAASGEPAAGEPAAGEPTAEAPGGGATGGGRAGKPTNLEILPRSWSTSQVNDYMKKQVSRGLGVKCNHCHEKGDFASDKNPHKAQARAMIRMNGDLNRQFFRGKRTLSCFTCHQGKPKPDTSR